jgi:hypothetical protein
MQKNRLILICCVLISVTAFTQDSTGSRKISKNEKQEARKKQIDDIIKKEAEGQLVYSKQNTFSIKLNSNGWGLFYERGRFINVNKTFLWWAELSEIKSPKEEKNTRIDGFGFALGNPYIYGKINTVFSLRAGLGQQRLIGGKGNRNGVAVSAIYGGGLTAGLIKPYYLNVISDPSTGEISDIKYQGPGDSTFLDPFLILGGSGFGKGISEISLQPALHTRAGLRFDYGRYSELLSAIEVGVQAEYFFKELPIMAVAQNRQFVFNAYVAILFGNRK